MSTEETYNGLAGESKDDLVLPLVIAALSSAMVASAFASPVIFFFSLELIIFAASIFRWDPLLYLMVFLLPVAPLVQIADFPVHDVVSLARVLVFAGIFMRRTLDGESIKDWLWGGAIEKVGLLYFLVAVASALVANPASAGAVRSLFRLASYFAFYYTLTGWIRSADQLRRTISVLLASTVVICVISFFQVAQGAFGDWFYWLYSGQEEYLEPWQGRVSSVFIHVNQFAAYLNLALPLALAVESSRLTGVALRRVAALCFVFGTIALVLTQSRGAFLGYFCMVWIVLFAFRKQRPLRFKLLSGVFAVVVITSVIYLTSTQAFDISMGAGQTQVESWQRFVELDETTLERLYVYSSAWDMFLSRPAWGIGFGNFRSRLSEGMTGAPEAVWDTHNLYLKLLAETGVAGFLGFMGWMVVIGRQSRRSFEANGNVLERVLGSALLAALGAMLIHGLVDVMIDLPQFGALFWMLIALFVASRQLRGIRIRTAVGRA
jgi:putative inorganic carbon (hco3(-)) transporter